MKMKTIVLAAWVVFSATVAVESPAATADDAIKQVFVQLDRCLANNDAKCIGELMVEDATYSEPSSAAKIINGKMQIVKTLEDLMAPSAVRMKGTKQTNTVENVRMVGTDHAIVDASLQIAGMEPAEGEAADVPKQRYHTLAVMLLKGDKWLLQDIRVYTVGHAWPTNAQSSPPATKESLPSAKKESPPAAASQ